MEYRVIYTRTTNIVKMSTMKNRIHMLLIYRFSYGGNQLGCSHINMSSTFDKTSKFSHKSFQKHYPKKIIQSHECRMKIFLSLSLSIHPPKLDVYCISEYGKQKPTPKKLLCFTSLLYKLKPKWFWVQGLGFFIAIIFQTQLISGIF